MDEAKAIELAGIVGGEARQSGGWIWVVVAPLNNGKVIVYGEGSVAIYVSFGAYHAGDDPVWETH